MHTSSIFVLGAACSSLAVAMSQTNATQGLQEVHCGDMLLPSWTYSASGDVLAAIDALEDLGLDREWSPDSRDGNKCEIVSCAQNTVIEVCDVVSDDDRLVVKTSSIVEVAEVLLDCRWENEGEAIERVGGRAHNGIYEVGVYQKEGCEAVA